MLFCVSGADVNSTTRHKAIVEMGVIISTVLRTIFFRTKSYLFCTMLMYLLLSCFICASSCFLKNSFAAVNISRIFPSISTLNIAHISFLGVLRTAYFLIMVPLDWLAIIFHQDQFLLMIFKQIYLNHKTIYGCVLQFTYFTFSFMNSQIRWSKALNWSLVKTKLFGCWALTSFALHSQDYLSFSNTIL